MSTTAQAIGDSVALNGKVPRTERGRRTLRKLLDAAALEFSERGFHEASITSITARAGTALGTFYTYFRSKEELFQALVRDMSEQVRVHASGSVVPAMSAIEAERAALTAFLTFARDHKELYRIIDEAEFVDPASWRKHYETTAERILARLRRGVDQGELSDEVDEAHAWALMGMNVFLGLRYCVWGNDRTVEDVAAVASRLLETGMAR